MKGKGSKRKAGMGEKRKNRGKGKLGQARETGEKENKGGMNGTITNKCLRGEKTSKNKKKKSLPKI